MILSRPTYFKIRTHTIRMGCPQRHCGHFRGKNALPISGIELLLLLYPVRILTVPIPTYTEAKCFSFSYLQRFHNTKSIEF